MVALALYAGLNPIDLKLITALFVLVILIAPKVMGRRRSKTGRARDKVVKTVSSRKVMIGLGCLALLIVAGLSLYRISGSNTLSRSRMPKIGLVQLTDHGLLNITRDSFLAELKRLGYEEGKNVRILAENANGEMMTVNSILDKFLLEKVDVVLPISTGCTQAAIQKIKDRPVVFATVADPFIIGAGKSDRDHLPNVTGVYGAAPMDRMMAMVTRILPGRIKIGTIWDPSQQNAVFNVGRLKEVVAGIPGVTFVGATVSGSSEVYEAAASLAGKGIKAFVLAPDNIVYSAFESILKAAAPKKIPIFLSDVERLKDGALGACGYDYTSSGIQAARLVDRILKGEKPAAIPFQKYSRITVGLNLKAARELGLTLPRDLIAGSTITIGGDKVEAGPKRLALFSFSDSHILKLTCDGVMEELKRSGTLDRYRLTVDLKNAHNDYGMAQAIVQDIVRQKYDYLITVSTLALQVAANGNKQIPHIFGAVTDPYRMGVARSPAEHLANITGVATFQPVASTIKAMRAIFPRARRIGMIWNPAEANSEACTLKARSTAKEYGFQLIERTVSTTDEVKDALSAVLGQGVDLFFTSGDNTTILAMVTVADILKEHKVPYFTNNPSDVELGSFFSIGADYVEVGVEAAKMAERVIAGEHPKDIPIRDFVPEKIGINQALARLYRVTIPEELLKKAAVVKR
jgi:putative ABC transport system permease protein